jgi:hypothetical protein
MDFTMIPTRFRRAEGACDLGYDQNCDERRDSRQSVWWLGLVAAVFGFGLWFKWRPRPLEK